MSEGPAYKYCGDIFVFGGTASNQPSKTTVNYSPAPGGEGTTNAPSMLAARSAFAYATDPATGILYAIGGRGASNSVLSSAEIYNEAADQWSAIPPLTQPVYNAAGASDGAGHIFVFGGDSSTGQPLSTVYRYTIATQTWDTLSPMPMPLAHASAVYAAYGLIYLIGGVSTSGAVSNVEAYDPVTDTWSDETPLPSPVYGASAVIDANGNVQVIGGYDSSGARVVNVCTSSVGPAPV
jgi:N-acetylneuraminic acid mutarotase